MTDVDDAAARRAAPLTGALADVVEACRDFARRLPAAEPDQEARLLELLTGISRHVRRGALAFDAMPVDAPRVVRLHKETVGPGRLKLQVFALEKGESHPPHAHHDLLSCQVVVRGRARVTELDLLRRLPGNLLELGRETVRMLGPGDGVITLARRNNVHWQEGLSDGSVILNVNWQGFLGPPADAAPGPSGRRELAWEERRTGARTGSRIVPEIPVA